LDGLHEISKWKADWIGQILRRNWLLQQFIVGKIKGGIEMTERWGRRRRKLLDELKERRGNYYLKEEALDCTVWRARFGRGFGPLIRRTAKWMIEFGSVWRQKKIKNLHFMIHILQFITSCSIPPFPQCCKPSYTCWLHVTVV
jgi:hypothetical protein